MFTKTSEYVKPVSVIKIINRKRFDILEQNGRYSCWITGIAAGDDDIIFLCNFNNYTVKMQADLSLRWAHMPFCWFCREAAHLIVICLTEIPRIRKAM